ncbi:hypothetical protein F4678DRAFT_477082 [Xylaria arbuscula]|nr:hypothetical protein F4678DRAFT_477082 [Xylaria arbuscula]
MTPIIKDISGLPPDTSRGYIINILVWFGCGISTICVVLRVYSRTYIIRRPGWDDAIVIFATLLNTSTRALIDDIHFITYYNPILETLGIFAFCLPKLAVVILIKKLMGTATRGIWFLYGVIAVLFIMAPVCLTIVFLECNSRGQTIHPFSSTRCIPTHVFDIFITWSAFTDLALAISPAVFLWNLQMKVSRKITIILIMSLGFFAMIAAIVKTLQLPNQNSPDPTYDLFWLYITLALVLPA